MMFSNGTEYHDWIETNCMNCPFYVEWDDKSEPCEVEDALSRASIVGEEAWPKEWMEEKNGTFICRKKVGLPKHAPETKERTNIQIYLPDIDIQEGWTCPGQLKKIGEEGGEVAEAVAVSDPIKIILESFDAMQTYKTLIALTMKEYGISHAGLVKLNEKHIEKLVAKGYLGKGE